MSVKEVKDPIMFVGENEIALFPINSIPSALEAGMAVIHEGAI